MEEKKKVIEEEKMSQEKKRSYGTELSKNRLVWTEANRKEEK